MVWKSLVFCSRFGRFICFEKDIKLLRLESLSQLFIRQSILKSNELDDFREKVQCFRILHA